MFAYCLNNPVNGTDYNGFRGFFDTLEDIVEKAKRVLGIGDFDDLSLSEEDDSVKISNSASIKDPFAIFIYSVYVNDISEYKDQINGTSIAVAYEWIFHNIAYDAARGAELFGFDTSGLQRTVKDVNIGSTIFSDDHGYPSYVMGSTYCYASPITAFIDAVVAILGG